MRPHLVKSYKGMQSPAFNGYVYKYYGKDYHKELQWVRKRGIDLRGFTLNVYGDVRSCPSTDVIVYGDVRSGPVLMKLMGYGPYYLNLDLAKYYDTRGKLTHPNKVLNGRIALTCACVQGYVETVKCLLAAGADKDKGESIDRTPLIWAAEKGHIEIVQILLSAGAKMDKVDTGGNTALSIATEKGHQEIVQLLQPAAQ